MAAAIEIPLFPLNTVLFPGGPLGLRIFEARYIDMIRRCMREDTGFGVVLIREGPEAGGPATTFDVGTYARIDDFSQQPDGLLGISAIGTRRFRILERRRARDGLNLADIEWLPEEALVALPAEFAELGPAVVAALDQAGAPYLGLERQPGDAAWVSSRLAEILPLPVAHKQHTLELDDPVERLRYLRPLFEISQS
ncbi:MAG: LON peptidase substrate-binding domain-containing protein [Steroidobacteraceae bacterium]